MKNKKKGQLFATSVAATLAASAIAPVVAAAETQDFPDVAKTYPYYNTIKDLVEADVVHGYGDGTFRTEGQVTRAEAAVMVTNILKLEKAPTDAPFADVEAGMWYEDAINALYHAGFIKGITETTFAPNQTMTRAQLSQLIVTAYGIKGKETTLPFEDVKAGAWYETAISKLYSEGLIKGQTLTSFGPEKNIKRGDFAWLLANTDYKFGNTLPKPEVAKIVSIDAIEDITIKEGEAVVLPKIVKATYDDKSTKDVDITWNADKFDFTKVGSYDLTGTIKDTDKVAQVKVVVKAVTPEVTSVDAINATQLEVKFNKAVDKDTLFTDGKSGAFHASSTVTFTTIAADNVASGTVTGELSADGKTLLVTSQNALSKRYDVVIDGLKSVDGKDIVKYEKMITIAADKTAPTIIGTEKLSATTVKVKFSEPMKAIGTPTFKYADGSTVTGASVSPGFNAGESEVTFILAGGVTAGKEIVATFIGAQDQAGNLLTPNPATVTFQKGDKDGIAPTVDAITQTGATTFSIKFSEQLQADPTVTYATAATTVVKDATDPTVYNVTVAAGTVLDGAKTVEVSAFTDLSGEVGTTTSKVVTFVKNTDAPKVTSSAVVKDATDAKEYLELTFDKDVNLDGTPADSTVSAVGTYVKNYVTSAQISPGPKAVTYKNTSNKKVVRVALNSFLTGNDVKDAVYTLDLTFAKLTSDAGTVADTKKVTFTRGEDGTASSVAVAKVTGVAAGSDNNKIAVTFDQAVDGASATDIANYKVDGAIVESVTLQPASGTQVAVLNLKSGSNSFTGTRNINISGVKALGSSKVMTPFFENTVSLKENIAPTVTSAKLTDTNKVTLTFSESVITTPVTGSVVDFELLIGGATVATNDQVTTAIQASPGANTVVFTLEDNVTAANITSGLSLKVLSGLNIKDAAGNNLSVPANIVITQ